MGGTFPPAPNVGGLLDWAQVRDAFVDTTVPFTSDVPALVDPSLVMAFVMPASGAARIQMYSFGTVGTATYSGTWCLLDATDTVVAGTAQLVINAITGESCSYDQVVTGAPGVSMTYKWAAATSTTPGTHTLYHGPTYGCLTMTAAAV